MSLINQMLQDLDSRRAASGPGSGLPNEVRPLPAARRSTAPLLAGVGVALALLAGWFFWQLNDLRSAQERRLEVASAVVPVAPVVPDVPAAPAVPASPLPPQATVVPDQAVSPSPDASLRLTKSLQGLPESAPEARPVPPARVLVPASPPTVPALPASSTLPPAKSSGPVVLEKSSSAPAAGTSHERAEGEYRRAIGAVNSGRVIEAIDNLRAALRLEEVHAASRQLLFRLLVENNGLDEAGTLLQEGLVVQPAQVSWAMSAARMQVDRVDLPGAWNTLQRSLPFAANNADYQGFAGHVLQRLGRSKEAAEYYLAATRLAPAEGRWWLGLGLALDADGHVAEAREALLRAKASGTLNAELIALIDQRLR